MNVSVVMPSFNHAAFIGEAVESVLSQGHPAVELRVLDGGSQDGTRAVLDSVRVPPGKTFLWRSAPDRGQADAVNTGWRQVAGDVIGWLNSDDLYAPGAVERAVAHFAAHPDHMMVYGEAIWIDGAGRTIGRYPTERPEGGIERFLKGCFICQPTVFLRRAALERIGLLDEDLHSAMDFDLWVRAFRAFPGRIGFIPALQAMSRLHGMTKTERDRARVMVEGMTVLARHFGSAPPAWIHSYVGEALAAHLTDETAPLPPIRRLARAVLPLLRPEDRAGLRPWRRGNAPLRLATEQVAVDIHADGWTHPETTIRLRRKAQPETVVVVGYNQRPLAGPMTVTALKDGRPVRQLVVPQGAKFELLLPLPPAAHDGAMETIGLTCAPFFVPNRVDPGSGDGRTLGFSVDRVEIRPA